MINTNNFFLKPLFLILCFTLHAFCSKTDTTTSNFYIRDPDFVVPNGHVFKLRFLTPHNTTNRYLTIHHVISKNSITWMANRDNPLTDTSSTLTISENSNLVLINGLKETIWSTNTMSTNNNNNPMHFNTTAQIHDDGNLVLRWCGSGFIHSAGFSESDNNDKELVIILPVVVVFASVCSCLFIGLCWMAKKRGNQLKEQKKLEALQSDSWAIVLGDESKNINIKGSPLFTFKTLAYTTNQFHQDNMLWRDGFGYVYKGKLANGKYIAVKRLSAASEQGAEEFKNEIIVISKVQHRNFVKLLGCCVEKEEKMLMFEYTPNKSLDVCLFSTILNTSQFSKHYLQ